MSWAMKLVFASGKDSIEVTNLFNHFKCVWSDVYKMIHNKNLEWNLGMKLIRMNLGMKLNFCMLLGIHKYIY